MDPVATFLDQAEACRRLGSPMYAELLGRCAAELRAARPAPALTEVLEGHHDDPGPSALALRLLGSVHALVLDRRAGALATYYPSVGGRWSLAGGWEAFLEVLAAHRDELGDRMQSAPQTNEVGRSSALYGGLLHLARDLPVRLVELGSSAGLNLYPDRLAYTDDRGHTFGDAASPVRLTEAWLGRRLTPWPSLRIVERRGSDIAPVDVGSTAGRLRLTSYCWPDQVERLDRLRGALALAAREPAQVLRAGAAETVHTLRLVEGTTTVLWHSVMWQYLDADEQARVQAGVERLGEAATDTARFAYLRVEPRRLAPGGDREFCVDLVTWPVRSGRLLGTTLGHGVPTTWL